MNFKYVVIVLLGGFVIMMSTLSYKAVSTKFYLVTDKYYEEGVNYDATQAKLYNVDSLKQKVVVQTTGDKLFVQIPTKVQSGKVVLYRPSDGTKDIVHTLKENETLIHFDINQLVKGKWIAKIEWTDETQKPYYTEKDIFIK